MNVVVPLEHDQHMQVQALLPWYVSAQLDDDEVRMVQAHLQQCPRCRTELEAEQALQQGQGCWNGARPMGSLGDAAPRTGEATATTGAGAVDQGLQRMDARIRALNPAAAPSGGPARRWPWVGPLHWWGWMALLQGVAIVLLLTLVVRGNQGQAGADAAPYRALSATPVAAQGQGLVMFRPEATEQQLRQALQACGASLAGGPTASHAYVLRLDRASAEAMACLRTQAVVSMAEPLDPGALLAPARP